MRYVRRTPVQSELYQTVHLRHGHSIGFLPRRLDTVHDYKFTGGLYGYCIIGGNSTQKEVTDGEEDTASEECDHMQAA